MLLIICSQSKIAQRAVIMHRLDTPSSMPQCIKLYTTICDDPKNGRKFQRQLGNYRNEIFIRRMIIQCNDKKNHMYTAEIRVIIRLRFHNVFYQFESSRSVSLVVEYRHILNQNIAQPFPSMSGLDRKGRAMFRLGT